jgi:hypothetical protein
MGSLLYEANIIANDSWAYSRHSLIRGIRVDNLIFPLPSSSVFFYRESQGLVAFHDPTLPRIDGHLRAVGHVKFA